MIIWYSRSHPVSPTHEEFERVSPSNTPRGTAALIRDSDNILNPSLETLNHERAAWQACSLARTLHAELFPAGPVALSTRLIANSERGKGSEW